MILKNVPGFKGYIERTQRRDADKLLREKVSRDFEALWQRLSALQKEMLNQGGLAYVDDMEGAAVKLRTFIDRVRTATYGYSSLLDAVQINQTELARLYEFDAALLGYVSEVSGALDNVEAAIGTEGLPAAIRNLTIIAGQCVETFSKRQEVLMAETASSAKEPSMPVSNPQKELPASNPNPQPEPPTSNTNPQ
jgi:hypothetical protein